MKIILTLLVVTAVICINITRCENMSIRANPSGGWRPITAREAYKGLLNFGERNFGHVNTRWEPTAGQAGNTDELRNEAIKLVQPQQVLEFVIKREVAEDSQQRSDASGAFSSGINECEQDTTICEMNRIKTREVFVETKNVMMADKATRKGRKLVGNNSDINNNSIDTKIEETIPIEEIIKNKVSNNKLVLPSNMYKSSYEVTEKLDVNLGNYQNDKGYHYTPPVKNLTQIFFDILSKYKIKDTDVNKNYELSRLLSNKIIDRPKVIYLPIPVNGRQNRAMDIPINPLLAVFLSNYGYYLQGHYGIHNSYRNLYGYTASNNIHNNMPFGFYKQFSDTISSYK